MSMIIKDIRYEFIEIPYREPFYPTWYPERPELGQMILLVRVMTDDGLEGHATCEAPFGIVPVLKATVEYIKSFIIGTSVFDIEKNLLHFRNVARIATRPWLLENALWDLIGKACGQPLYKIWGASRDRIKVYAAWGEVRPLEERKENAIMLVEQGFKAVKLRFYQQEMKDDIALIEAVRDAVGNRLDIMVDANQGTAVERTKNNNPPVWSYNRAKETAREMERLNCLWLEEPCYRYDFDTLARLNREVDIPIAGGEINVGVHEFKLMLEKGSYDIVQPNCTMSGGMSHIRKIAAIADSFGKICNPHAWIPGLGVLQSMHIVASIPNFTYLEYPYDPPKITPESFQGIVKDYYTVDSDGYITMPDKPGLGIDLDEEKIKRYKV